MILLFLKFIYFLILIILLCIIAYLWFHRIKKIIDNYLQVFCGVINCKPLYKKRFLPLYSKTEIAGTFNERPVIAGIQYIGLGFEWMPLPYIKIKLKDVLRYNYDRVPDFAFIERGWLIFKIKERLVWGVFDKNYERFFTKDFIVIALNRLFAVAEDAERGKTMGEIFK